jgi:MraZ protein
VDLYDTFEHTIDAKGRLVLPAAYRSTFADGGFAVNLGDCIGIFSVADWEKWRRRVEQSRVLDRSRLKYLIASVSPIQPDGQNRVTINPRLRSKIGLERDVTIVGSGMYASVYDRTAWERFEASAEAPDADGRTLADELADLEFV